MDEQETLHKAIQAIQSGDTDVGRQLLGQVLRADPKNAQAWLWMSDVVDTDDLKADCLRRALALDLSDQERQDARARQARLGLPPTHKQETAYPFPAARAAPPSPESSTTEQDNRSLFTIRSGEGATGPSLATEQRTLALASGARERGYRNTMIAGAMLLLLLGGLGLLVHTVTNIVPQAQERLRPTPEAVLYEATLWCVPCQQAGSQIVLWEKVGDGVSRGGKTGELPHNTPVSVLAEEWSEPEERRYYKVAALGQKGWIPDTFLQK